MVLGLGKIGRVWTSENNISSDGNSVELLLPGLASTALEAISDLVSIDGRTKLNGIFTYSPFQEGKNVTTDGFDQVQMYSSLYGVQQYLMSMGVDIKSIIAGQHQGKHHPLKAHANKVDDLNAWYSPQSDDLTFGTNGDMTKGEDKWHLASDGDVVVHEAGHLLLDHMNKKLGSWWSDKRNCASCSPQDLEPDPGWSAGDGRAIHEGFADALAALYHNDPEMSEDFGPQIGEPPSKKGGLRIVDNELTLDEAGWEEHDRGRVYSAFFWAIKKALVDPNGPFKMDDRMARDLTTLIVINHAANYTTSRPQAKDFVDAVQAAIDDLSRAGMLPKDATMLKEFVAAEAKKRKMLEPPKKADEPPILLPDEKLRFRSIEDASKAFGEHIRFVPEQRTAYIAGYSDVYQQQYRTGRFGFVDVVGYGILARSGKDGRTREVFARDVMPLNEGEIDESLAVSPQKAYQLAVASAGDHLKKVRANKFILVPRGSKGKPLTKLDLYKEAQMEGRIAEAALKNLQDKKFMNAQQPKLVIVPGTQELSYEIKVGLGIYYVGAKSGSVTFVRDVMVN